MSLVVSIPTVTVDPVAVEAARIATLAWGKAAAKADSLSETMAKAIKAAWPVESNFDSKAVRGWLVEAAIASNGKAWGEVYNAPAPAQPTGTEWKRAHNLIDNRLRLAKAAAYPAPAPAPAPAVIPTAAQIVATAAAATAKASTLEAAQASVDAEIAKAAAAIKAAEAKAEAARVKAAEAAAKLDATKAAEAEAAKAKAAEAAKAAAEAKAEAEAAEKAKAEKAAAAKAAQADATAKAEAIQTEKKVKACISDTEALLMSIGALQCPGIVDFATAVRNALAAFKAAQV